MGYFSLGWTDRWTGIMLLLSWLKIKIFRHCKWWQNPRKMDQDRMQSVWLRKKFWRTDPAFVSFSKLGPYIISHLLLLFSQYLGNIWHIFGSFCIRVKYYLDTFCSEVTQCLALVSTINFGSYIILYKDTWIGKW